MFAISRIEQYKFSSCEAVFAESQRTLAKYDNPHYHPEKTADNYYFVRPEFSGKLGDYILEVKQKNKCRLSVDPALPLNKQTNCFCQAIFATSPELLKNLSRQQINDFYGECFEFFKTEFPSSVEILSACVHWDETTPHMHIDFLPLVTKTNSKGKVKTGFCASDLFDGEDFFTKYQDRFYDYISNRHPEMELKRKGEIHQDHLSVREYKKVMGEVQEAREELEDIKFMQSQIVDPIPSLQMKIENANLRKENNRLREDVGYYRRFLDFLFSKFPKLQTLYDMWRRAPRSNQLEK